MVGKPGSGRRPGFKHPEKTKKKIADSCRGKQIPEISRQKISQTHRLRNLDNQCKRRLEDLKSDYPSELPFFDANRSELLLAMKDVRTDRELMDIRLYIETSPLRLEERYQSFSSSYFATEDAMIALLDLKIFLEKHMANSF